MHSDDTPASHRLLRRSRIQRLKNEFLSLAAHEIRTPITVIKAQAQLAERFHGQGKLEGDLLARSLKVFVHESDRLARLCSDLLDVARIDNGGIDIKSGAADIVKLVRDVTARIWSDSHEIVVEYAYESLDLFIDRERIERVLHNLLANAIRYSPNGGTISIRLGRTPTEATIAIRDQGLGIATRELARIFDRYYQADQTGPLSPAGLGIGLYLSREIVRRMGGLITAKSEGLGKGSEFIISLPLKTEDTLHA